MSVVCTCVEAGYCAVHEDSNDREEGQDFDQEGVLMVCKARGEGVGFVVVFHMCVLGRG